MQTSTPPSENPYAGKLADARLRLQQTMAMRDDHAGEPAYERAVEQCSAELADVAFLHAQAAAPYVQTLADTLFYG